MKAKRRGLTTPAVAVALLVMMMGLALILDRIWLETAQLELRNAAEAAALAAAGELATDDLLLDRDTTDLRINNARQVAGWIASQNVVCGTPVTLDTEPGGDVRLGHLVREAQGVRFQESDDNPHAVVVTAMRTRSNNNPVGLFVSGATGVAFGDVAARVEASVDNAIAGLRPIQGASIPAIPIAIWDVDPTGQRPDTWSVAIQSRRGSDDYGYDSQTHTVYRGSDGIPELVIQSSGRLGSSRKSNVRVVDIGTGLANAEIKRQFETGISVQDVSGLGGELLLGRGQSLTLPSTPKFNEANVASWQQLVGERRICFLYKTSLSAGELSGEQAVCTDIVAIRILGVSSNPDGTCAVLVQPTLITTRTALLFSELATRQADPNEAFPQVDDSTRDTNSSMASGRIDSSFSEPNPYVYKLHITQ